MGGPLCTDGGTAAPRSARGVSARLSGRLRAPEPPAGSEVRSADPPPSDRSRQQAENPFDEPENPFDEPEKNPFEEPEKNPFNEPEKNPFDEPERNPFEEPEKNPFEEPGNNPFDEPEEGYEVEALGMEEGAKQPKEKTRKRDKLGKMFRGLKSKKEDGTGEAAEKKQKKSSQGRFAFQCFSLVSTQYVG